MSAGFLRIVYYYYIRATRLSVYSSHFQRVFFERFGDQYFSEQECVLEVTSLCKERSNTKGETLSE
jgi:hypothetical protein